MPVNDDSTQFLPPTVPPTTAHAWSLESDPDSFNTVRSQDGHKPLPLALKVLLASVVVGVIALPVWLFAVSHRDSTPAPMPSAQTTTTTADPPLQVTPDPAVDDAFRQQVKLTSPPPGWHEVGTLQIRWAHSMCRELRRTDHPTVDQVATTFTKPPMSLRDDNDQLVPWDMTRAIVVAAQDHYCPETKR